MADGFRIDASWLGALDRYVEGLMRDTREVAEGAVSYLHDEVVDAAREHPEWVGLADNIEAWSQDGRLAIGVHDNAMSSQAFALEYGDDNRPPTPLFRKLSPLVRKTEDRMERELLARRGVPPIKGMKV